MFFLQERNVKDNTQLEYYFYAERLPEASDIPKTTLPEHIKRAYPMRLLYAWNQRSLS